MLIRKKINIKYFSIIVSLCCVFSAEPIEQNNALIEQRIKDAEKAAFQKGKEEGLTEGHNNGISEARSQSQQGLDAAISVFRIAAETIDNSDQAN